MWRNLCGHWQDLFWKQISFNLAVFGKDESNFRKNNIMFQFSSVAQSCPTLCDPMNCSTPGLPVHQQLPEFTQTHVHWVSDAIQPSHPLSSPSPPALNLSQHQGLIKWVSSASGGQSIEVSASTSVLPMNTQDWSFQWIWNSSSVNWDLYLFPWCSEQKESYLVQLSQSINTMTWHCFKSAAKSTCAMLVWQLGISDKMHSTRSVSPLIPLSPFRKSG